MSRKELVDKLAELCRQQDDTFVEECCEKTVQQLKRIGSLEFLRSGSSLSSRIWIAESEAGKEQALALSHSGKVRVEQLIDEFRRARAEAVSRGDAAEAQVVAKYKTALQGLLLEVRQGLASLPRFS